MHLQFEDLTFIMACSIHLFIIDIKLWDLTEHLTINVFSSKCKSYKLLWLKYAETFENLDILLKQILSEIKIIDIISIVLLNDTKYAKKN